MYVILQPNSNTNDSDKYLVVDLSEFNRFRQGEISQYKMCASVDTYADAEIIRDTRNQVARVRAGARTTWSVWTKVNGTQTPIGYQGGTDAMITDGLTEKQARDIMEHLRTYCGDVNVTVEKD